MLEKRPPGFQRVIEELERLARLLAELTKRIEKLEDDHNRLRNRGD